MSVVAGKPRIKKGMVRINVLEFTRGICMFQIPHTPNSSDDFLKLRAGDLISPYFNDSPFSLCLLKYLEPDLENLLIFVIIIKEGNAVG